MRLHALLSLRRCRTRAGMALPAALFGVVTVSLLAGGMMVMTTRNGGLARNREEAARAVMLAEAAASHAIAVLRQPLKGRAYNDILRGTDLVAGTSDDGLLAGYGMPSTSEIPATGVVLGQGTYYAKIIDDPGAGEDGNAFNDTNNRVVIRCTGVTRTGATAVINAIVGPTPVPAIAANGDVTISGGPSAGSITGPCGSIHANGNLSATSGITVAGEYSATGTATGANVVYPDGTAVQKESYADPVLIPRLNYSDYCPSSADYVLQSDGYVRDVHANQTLNANGGGALGWRAGNAGGQLMWTQAGTFLPGTVCAEGNVTIGGSPGPLSVSIIAQGSISITGTPKFTAPSHPDGLLFFAGGDISFGGDASTEYVGHIYARNQCDIGGNPYVTGSIMCFGEVTVAPARNLANGNTINGNVTVTYDCTGLFANIRKIIGWYQTVS